MNISPIEDVLPSTVDKTEQYIQDLETEVAQLIAANKLLKKKLKSKPSLVTQKMYDELCVKYQTECSKNIPF